MKRWGLWDRRRLPRNTVHSADQFQGSVSSVSLAVVARRYRHLSPEFSAEVACVAPNLTMVAVLPSKNPLPLTVTFVPPACGPVFGLTPVIVGVVLTLLLALVADALLVAIQYVLTPWTRRRA